MSDRATEDGTLDRAETELPAPEEPMSSIEAYETEDGVVFYDAENPLGWLKSSSAVTLKKQV
ncbi:hypothetical protein ACFFQF_15830 [Haladaptatus pallidirubidus]|uniref:Uncharacterized protein n=1 Tax=Haladaptatus pallidirubidus TaxID=1008152 RepID=A0AAV3UCP4_9EURY|nr:hypothetical protein [Haladaptatus pallidirubidus]